jgi:hypothetical protein
MAACLMSLAPLVVAAIASPVLQESVELASGGPLLNLLGIAPL